MAGDLPERGSVHALVQDHVDPNLFFAGTEFGVWFTTLTRATRWVELTGGLPTIAVRDVEIQRRENDLVLGTFGRSFYVLDDYSPLRGTRRRQPSRPSATLFAPKRRRLVHRRARGAAA